MEWQSSALRIFKDRWQRWNPPAAKHEVRRDLCRGESPGGHLLRERWIKIPVPAHFLLAFSDTRVLQSSVYMFHSPVDLQHCLGTVALKCSFFWIIIAVHICKFQKLCQSPDCSAYISIVYHSCRAWHLDWKLLRASTLWHPRWEWQFSVSSSCRFLHVFDNDNPVAGKRQKPVTFKEEAIQNWV